MKISCGAVNRSGSRGPINRSGMNRAGYQKFSASETILRTTPTHDRVRMSMAMWKDKVIAGTDVAEDVFESAFNISMEIAREGREGKPVGTAFIIGDADNVLAKSRQLILNPFEGHAQESRMITNPEIREMIKELAQLDGAFVVRGNGLIEAGSPPDNHRDEQRPVPEGPRYPALFSGRYHPGHQRNRDRRFPERGKDLHFPERQDRAGDLIGLRISGSTSYPVVVAVKRLPLNDPVCRIPGSRIRFVPK